MPFFPFRFCYKTEYFSANTIRTANTVVLLNAEPSYLVASKDNFFFFWQPPVESIRKVHMQRTTNKKNV